MCRGARNEKAHVDTVSYCVGNVRGNRFWRLAVTRRIGNERSTHASDELDARHVNYRTVAVWVDRTNKVFSGKGAVDDNANEYTIKVIGDRHAGAKISTVQMPHI